MKKSLFFLLLVCFALTAPQPAQAFLGLFIGQEGKKGVRVKFLEGDENAKDEILLIKLRGVIQERSDDESNPFKAGKDMIEEIKKDLDAARKRKAVKAILLEINSPGGEVTASDVIYHQIKKMREETGKPTVAIIGAIGASGAYYVACGADKIFAHPTSIIGSIGVLMQSMNVQQLAEKIGLKAVTLKSDKTPMKDVLSPFKQMTEEERNMLLSIIDSVYDRFIDIVAASRKLERDAVIKLADGGIYTAGKAKETGLVDEIGYREDAIAEACKLADIKSAALVQRVSKKSFAELVAELQEMNFAVPAVINRLETLLQHGSSPAVMFR